MSEKHKHIPVMLNEVLAALNPQDGETYVDATFGNGGYTEANAQAFSDMMKEQLGWETYGDTTYPEHVLRYYK